MYDQIAVAIAIKGMESDKLGCTWFDVCGLTKLCEARGIEYSGVPAYERLHTMHCVQWRDIPERARKAMIKDICELTGCWIKLPGARSCTST